MQISVASSSLLALPIIEAIQSSEHDLASIITTPDRKTGRGQTLAPSELAAWAAGSDLVVAKPTDTPSLNQHLLAAQPQLIITISYGRMIPVEVLHGPRFGWLNIHFSLLPRWRGAAPVQWAILEGDTTTGVSIFKLDKGMDTGPIFYQEEVEISATDTTDSLLHSMSDLAGARIMDVVAEIRKGGKPKAQPNSGITLAPKISKEMGELDWSANAELIFRKIRALGSRPGTWTTFREQRLAIHELREYFGVNSLQNAGEISLEDGHLIIRCADSVLEVMTLTPAGKKQMSGADFARGQRITSGESFA